MTSKFNNALTIIRDFFHKAMIINGLPEEKANKICSVAVDALDKCASYSKR